MAKKYLIFYNGHVREVVNDKFTADGVVHSVARFADAEKALTNAINATDSHPFLNKVNVSTPLQRRYGIPRFEKPYGQHDQSKYKEEMEYMLFDINEAQKKRTPYHIAWYASRKRKYPIHRGGWEYFVIDYKTPDERRVIQDTFLNYFYENNNHTVPQDAEQMITRYEFKEIPFDRIYKKPDGSELCEHGMRVLLEWGKEIHEKKLELARFGGAFMKKNLSDEEFIKLGYKDRGSFSSLIEPAVFSLFPGRKPMTEDEVKEMKSLVDNYAYKTAQEARVVVSIARGKIQESFSSEPILFAPYLFGPNAVADVEHPDMSCLRSQIGVNGVAGIALCEDTTQIAMSEEKFEKKSGDMPFYDYFRNPAGDSCRKYFEGNEVDEYFIGPKYRVRTAVMVAGLRALMMDEGARLFDEIPEITTSNLESFSVDFTPGVAHRCGCKEDFVGYDQKYSEIAGGFISVETCRTNVDNNGIGKLATQIPCICGFSTPDYMEILERNFEDADKQWDTKTDARELDFESLIYEFSRYRLRLPMFSLMKSLASVGSKRYDKLSRIEAAVERLSNYYGGELSYRIRHREFSITREDYEADVEFERYMAEAEEYLEPEDYFSNCVYSAPPGKIDRVRQKLAEKVERDRRILEREQEHKKVRMSRPVGTYEEACEEPEAQSEVDYGDL